MDTENIASILKDAINASSTKNQSESKHTKVFVLPPELLNGLLVKNETPKCENVVKAETSSSKDSEKTTKRKRKSLDNSKLSVDQSRTSNTRSVVRKELKNIRLQKSLKNDLKSLKSKGQNYDQNTVFENNEMSDTLKSVDEIAMQRKPTYSRKAKIKNENEPSGICNNMEKSFDTIPNLSKTSDVTQKVLNKKKSLGVDLNNEKGMNILLPEPIQIFNEKEITNAEEKTYILEEIIELVESDELLEKNYEVGLVKENEIQTDKILSVENFPVDFESNIKLKRSNVVKAYANKRKIGKQISNNIKERSQNLQKVQEKSKTRIDCDFNKTNLIKPTVTNITNINSSEVSTSSLKSKQKIKSDTKCNSDQNSLTIGFGIDTFSNTQYKKIKDLQEAQKQSDSKADFNHDKSIVLIEKPFVNASEKMKYLPDIEENGLTTIVRTGTFNSSTCQETQYSQVFDKNNLNTVKTETSKMNSYKELKPEEIISVLENDITNDIDKLDGENKVLGPVEELIDSLQNHKENVEFQSINSFEKTNNANKKLKNQTGHEEIKTSNMRNRRKLSNAKKGEASSSKTVKLISEQMEIDAEDTKDIDDNAVDGNVNNDIEQISADSANESKSSISCNNELDKGNDYWENENNCSIKSLRQLRNRTKVIPQDPENFNKFKSNVEKESLRLRNCDKSNVVLRDNFEITNQTRNLPLNFESNSPEKLSLKPKSVDNYLESSDNITTFGKRSAISVNVAEESNNFQRKESLVSETMKRAKRKIDDKNYNQPIVFKDTVDVGNSSDFVSNILQKTEELIIVGNNWNESNLNEKSTCDIDDSQNANFSVKTAAVKSTSSLKRKRVIVVRKIEKKRASKSSQPPKDNPVVTTYLKKNYGKGNDTYNDSKIADNTVNCDSAMKNDLIETKISKRDEVIISLEDNADKKFNDSSVDSSNCQEIISLEKGCLKIKSETTTCIEKHKRAKLSKSISSKQIPIENPKGDFEVNKISHSIESTDGLRASEEALINDCTISNIQKMNENMILSKDNLDNASTCSSVYTLVADRQVNNALEKCGLAMKSEKVFLVQKGRTVRRSNSMISKDNIVLKKPVEGDCEYSECMDILPHNSVRTKHIVVSTEIQENSRVSDDSNEKSTCNPVQLFKADYKIENSSVQNSLKTQSIPLSSIKKGKRGRPPKSSQIDVNTKENEIMRNKCITSFVENDASSYKNSVTNVEEKDSTNMTFRTSGRRQRSNVNYCVPDEDVDVFDSEVRAEKMSSENVPKKRRGRPSKKDTSKFSISNADNIEQCFHESTQENSNLDATANDCKSSPLDGNTSTRKKRASKSTIDKDIFEVESESIVQEASLDIPRQLQTEPSSDAANATDDFLDSQDIGESEEDILEDKSCRVKERNGGFNTQTVKKRGRPAKKRPQESNDEDYTPHHSYVVHPTKVKETSKETTDKKMVKCGKCDKEVVKNQWYTHNLHSHNDMGWIDGTEKPDFENDQKLLMRVLTSAHKKKKKKGLICEACREVKKSVVGFLSHMRFCGKTEEEIASLLVTCEECGGKFKPSSMEYHERQHRLEAEGKKKKEHETLEKIKEAFEPRSKRKAAEKAVSKISEFTALVKDEEGMPDTKKMKLSSAHLKKFIQKPQSAKKISSIVLVKWRKELENNQDATCNQLGCQFTSKSLDEMREHYSSCKFTATENYVCKVCRYQTLSEDEIVKHATEKHTAEDLDINATISDAESSNSEDASDFDEDDGNHGSKQTQGSVKVKTVSHKKAADQVDKVFKFILNNGIGHAMPNKIFLSGFQWTLEFERNHFKFRIFDEFTPNAFTMLEETDANNYLPELEKSMPVRFKKDGEFLGGSDWKNWSRFEASRVDDSPTFFVGGPVWAMAWAPTPSVVAISDDLPQFLAISTHPSMDVEYTCGKSYSGKNIIQIWNVGKLNNSNASESNPELSYAIAHRGGTVWSLEWCPSGCYQHEDFPYLKHENDSNRLGLLAAGCSDGSIRIYSLVFPQQLYKLHRPSDKRYPIYETEPVVQLIINSEIHDSKSESWQIVKLCWSRESGHNVIVGGFTNGYVAFWDLSTKSPILKYNVSNTTFIRPYKQFFAHHHAVTMVALVSQDNKRYLATASLDKLYKFWDLEDISKPKNTYKKSFVTDGSWMNNWCCGFIAHDEALCMGHNPSICLPLRNYTYKYYNMLPSNSTIYAIATSDFGNGLATGNIAGELLALFPHQILYLRDVERTIPPKRNYSLISTTELVDFELKSSNDQPLKKDKKGKKNAPYSVPTDFMPSTYKDSKDRFGIQFNDNLNLFQSYSKKYQKIKGKQTLTCEKLESTAIEQYPLKSINKVAWNPNASSFLWLATGYQNGFVRLISFRSAASTVECNKLLELHTNELKAQMTKKADEDDC